MPPLLNESQLHTLRRCHEPHYAGETRASVCGTGAASSATKNFCFAPPPPHFSGLAVIRITSACSCVHPGFQILADVWRADCLQELQPPWMASRTAPWVGAGPLRPVRELLPVRPGGGKHSLDCGSGPSGGLSDPPIILALLVNQLQSERFKKFTQTVLYSPAFISTVVVVGIMFVILSPRSGW